MTDHRNKLCVALDGSDRDWITTTARDLGPHVGWLKLGLEAFTAFGPSLVETMAASSRVFLDVKLHDIPNTVRRAVANCAVTGAAMVNVHAAGGRAMLAAAVEGAHTNATGHRPLVIAVTILTSLDAAALAELGLPAAPSDLVVRWAELARAAGLDGVVASAHEATAIRRACGEDFLIVTPGIRPAGSSAGDQKRVMSPAEAVAAGADILVVGRPITAARRPQVAVAEIVRELAV